MCGIILARRKDNRPVGKAVLKRYKKQRERGKQGFGFITIDNGKISGVHRFEKEADSDNALLASTSSSILFHHRLPTSTPNYEDMTHPIVVKNETLDKDYYVVHNGVIQNDDELRIKHEKLGFKYTTDMREIFTVETISGSTETITEKFNDSEALAIEVALYLEGKQTTIDAVGSIAFACIETDKEGNVLNTHYGRNAGNPLVVEDNNDLFFIKSTGEGVKAIEDEILTINYSTNERTSRKVFVGKAFSVATPYFPKGGYEQHNRSVGFGAFERDKEDWSKHRVGIPSTENEKASRDGLLAIEDYDYDDTDWDLEFSSHKLTDGYLLDLWAEIESLKQDIKECRTALNDTHALGSEDIIYNEEYLGECVDNLSTKQSEANKLEVFLRRHDRM